MEQLKERDSERGEKRYRQLERERERNRDKGIYERIYNFFLVFKKIQKSSFSFMARPLPSPPPWHPWRNFFSELPLANLYFCIHNPPFDGQSPLRSGLIFYTQSNNNLNGRVHQKNYFTCGCPIRTSLERLCYILEPQVKNYGHVGTHKVMAKIMNVGLRQLSNLI